MGSTRRRSLQSFASWWRRRSRCTSAMANHSRPQPRDATSPTRCSGLPRPASFLLAALLAAAPALAAEDRFVALTIENDSFLFRGLDRHYSSGLQLSVLLPKDDLGALGRIAPFSWSDD